MGRTYTELKVEQKQRYARTRRNKYRAAHLFEQVCPRCGKRFRWLDGHNLSSVKTHPCEAITPYTLLHPEWDALARRVSRELPLFRAGSVEQA